MKVKCLKISGMFLVMLEQHGDERGYFIETYRHSVFKELGISHDFVQDNRSISKKNILRGMHYQIKKPQGHMISLLRGKIFDVGVDLRPNSQTFGQYCSVELSAAVPQQLYLPPGVAHGFCTLDDENELYYKCTDYYDANDEGGLLWCDPDVNIQWPLIDPFIKTRDQQFPMLSQIGYMQLPNV